jgi:hypothetical protein
MTKPPAQASACPKCGERTSSKHHVCEKPAPPQVWQSKTANAEPSLEPANDRCPKCGVFTGWGTGETCYHCADKLSDKAQNWDDNLRRFIPNWGEEKPSESAASKLQQESHTGQSDAEAELSPDLRNDKIKMLEAELAAIKDTPGGKRLYAALNEIEKLRAENAELSCAIETQRTLLNKERDSLRAQCEKLVAALKDIAETLNDCTVVCRKCGDEETLQDSDMAFMAREALAEYSQSSGTITRDITEEFKAALKGE